MKRIVFVAILSVFLGACSTEDDCEYDREEIKGIYDELLKNEMTPYQREIITKEYMRKLDDAC